MSKLYDNYLFLKSNEPDSSNTLYLFKSGIFFIFLADDAFIASKLFNLKITYLTENIVKCGFPINSLEKYRSLLEKSSYNFKIVDTHKNVTCTFDNFLLDEKVKKLLLEISLVDTNSLSVKEAYDFIEKIKSSAKFML